MVLKNGRSSDHNTKDWAKKLKRQVDRHNITLENSLDTYMIPVQMNEDLWGVLHKRSKDQEDDVLYLHTPEQLSTNGTKMQSGAYSTS